MGMIARLRRSVDLKWLHSWADKDSLLRLQREFAHYFRREGDRWYFFHNSFRQFLIEITSQLVPGEPCDQEHRRLHAELAKRCRESTEAENRSWQAEEVYHLSEAGAHAKLLERATQGFFREQFLDSRPPQAILNDIKIAGRSLSYEKDPVSAYRLSLARMEIERRQHVLESGQPIEDRQNLLLATGQF